MDVLKVNVPDITLQVKANVEKKAVIKKVLNNKNKKLIGVQKNVGNDISEVVDLIFEILSAQDVYKICIVNFNQVDLLNRKEDVNYSY